MCEEKYRGVSLEQALEHIDLDLFSDPIEVLAENLAKETLERYPKLTEEEIEQRRKYFENVPKRAEALKMAGEYVASLGLPKEFKINFEEPLFDRFSATLKEVDESLPVRFEDYGNRIPVQLEIPVTISLGNSKVKEYVYVMPSDDNALQQVKKVADIDWKNVKWKAYSRIKDVRHLIAEVEKRRHGYVLVELPDVDTAKKFAEELYKKEETRSVEVKEHIFDRGLETVMRNIKPEERKREILMEYEFRVPEQTDADIFIEENKKDLAKNYKGKILVISGSSIIGTYNSTKEVEKAEIKVPYVALNLTRSKESKYYFQPEVKAAD